MSGDTTYDVVANLIVKQGDAVARLEQTAKAADSASASFATAARGAMSFSGGLVDLAANAAKYAAGIAAIGVGVGGALVTKMASGIGANLSLLEDKGIQLGAVIAAATSVPFDEARISSDKLFEQFRQDAITSAGETKDFIDVSAKLAGPFLGAGKSMEDLHQVTKGVMNIAPALGIAFEQAGSDVMRMAQGVAGAEQPLFRAMVSIPSLGIKKAEEFNKLSPEKRLEKIQQALSNPAFAAAAAAYGNSFTGLISTVQDQLKTIGGYVGGPTFDIIKRGLQKLTGGVTDELKGGRLKDALQVLGTNIATRFESIGIALRRIFPDLTDDATGLVRVITNLVDGGMSRLLRATNWVADRWPEITDGAQRAAKWIEHAAESATAMVKAIGGGDTLKGVERIAEIFAARKAASALAPMAGGALQMGQGLFGAGKALFGSAAEAGVAKAATGAGAGMLGTMPVAEKLGGVAVGTFGAAPSLDAFATAAPAVSGLSAGVTALGAAALIVVGAIGVGTEMFLAFKANFLGVADSLKQSFSQLSTMGGGLSDEMGKLWDALVRLFEACEPLLAAIGTPLLMALNGVVDEATLLAGVLVSLTSGMTAAINKTSEWIEQLEAKFGRTHTTMTGGHDTPIERDYSFFVAHGSVADAERRKASAANKAPAGGGQKVEVTIKWDLGDGNEDAIYLRTRKDIESALRDATVRSRVGPIRGA